MFDQSLLLDHGGARRAGALATSFVAQILAAGVLLVAPLLFREALPLRGLMHADYYPLRAAPQTAAPARVERETKAPSFSARSVFRAPTHQQMAASPSASTGIAIDAPTLDFGPTRGDAAPSRFAPLPELAPPPKPAAPAATESAARAPATPVRVSQGVLAAKLIRKVIPMYPPLARQARIQGTVHLIGVVDRDGTIQQLQVLSGHPMLVGAALAAVRQWLYQPTMLNGEPVQVLAPIDVTFTITQ